MFLCLELQVSLAGGYEGIEMGKRLRVEVRFWLWFDTARGFSASVAFALYGKRLTKKQSTETTRIPESTLSRVCEDLRMIGVVENKEGPPTGSKGKPPHVWYRAKVFSELMKSVLSD